MAQQGSNVSVWLSARQYARLETLAARTGQTKSDILRLALLDDAPEETDALLHITAQRLRAMADELTQ